MNNEEIERVVVCTTESTLLTCAKIISEANKEIRWEEVNVSSRDGKVTATVKHLVNGEIEIEKITTMLLSMAVGAEVQDKLTMAEIQDAEAGHEMNKQEENRVTCEITSNLIDKEENKQLSIDDIQIEEKRQNVDYKYKPDGLKKEYWDKAWAQGIERFMDKFDVPDNPSWEDVVDKFYKDMSELMSNIHNYEISELLEKTLILCLIYGIDPSSQPNPLRALKNILTKRTSDASHNVRDVFQKAYDKLTSNQKNALNKIRVINYNKHVVPFSKKCGMTFKKIVNKKNK